MKGALECNHFGAQQRQHERETLEDQTTKQGTQSIILPIRGLLKVYWVLFALRSHYTYPTQTVTFQEEYQLFNVFILQVNILIPW